MTVSSQHNVVQSVSRERLSFWAQMTEVSSPLRRIDVVVFALILGFGLVQLYFIARAPDFPGDDVFYADAGRSLIEHGFYGISGYAETNMPPGLSSILGLLCMAGACSHAVFLRVMPIFGTLGFLASYSLLRRQAPRGVAAAICLLLISSRIHFSLVTQLVFPAYPYLFATMSALLVARKFERASRFLSRLGWGILLTALIAASLMFASAAIAFLGAIVASICFVFFRDRHLAFSRLRIYLAVLLLGIAVQGLWVHSGRLDASAGIAASEWPVPGFPQSYMSQLKVKSGNYPELGMATPRDIAARVFQNACDHGNLLSRMLLRRLPQVAWMSVLVAGPLLLIALGWFSSIWSKGGGLQDWYFAGYEFIYLLWPWSTEARFFLPIAPLACLYAWQGAEVLASLAKNKPRMLGAVWFPVAIFLSVCAFFWTHGSGVGKQFENSGLEDEVSVILWLLSAILAAWMVRADSAWLTPGFALWRSTPVAVRQLFGRLLRLLPIVAVAGLIVLGLSMQLEIGRANLDPNSATNGSPDAVAGAWIGSHTDPNSVIMARHVPTLSHYSNRKIIWFPLSSNPHLLMEGILRHKINYVIVVHRESTDSYYLPSDDDCFAPLLTTYPDAFHLVVQTQKFRIYQVSKSPTIPAQNAVGLVP
jgi:hypothetical protein